ncbi:chemotaxis response regulator protein-glutamate methylesterase 3 [Paractinoplanes abujensis]|uniref:Protein-glutamate methylesterase/protein-glutamine glutaminase n=1 Tax=Paractinoplanes abujensis TaxID=882441 RepID=A0A7W7CQ72_9ACTN|nr:chemotaxis-specific protein-glutamate methyltransferase CheB [Actinoplanes abujensis]MBB4692712.1 two-component system chemotaxis response regulator CheB [Actinoplanes abujensis]GID22789.1 chemotaxis response regulator protein-glutamate methylesterase 3 [Actinoplanes abujensis]
MANTSVLVVDDSALMRRAIRGILEQAGGFEVSTARNGADALDQLDRARPDVVTLDVNMPEMDGLTCLAKIMAERPTPVVMVSSLTEANALVTLEALELGAVDYVAKPGGTVSLNMDDIATEITGKVRAAAKARIGRAHGLSARIRQTPPPREPAAGRRTDLVVIGSSTGGPALLADLLPQLPGTLSAPVVIAQHIPASFTATLARRLDESCALRVHEVDRIMTVRPGSIYLGRGSNDVVVARRTDGLIVKSVPAGAEYRWHPSVDRLVASARRHVAAERLVCALLTGMGDDGAAEMAAVRAEGGRTIAESEETAVVWGMPGELARRGGATEVLPSYAIADRLAQWVR